MQDEILDLISALQNQRAARAIRSRFNAGSVSGDIATFYALLSSDQQHAKHVAPLIKLVLTDAKDVDIWTAVFDLVTPSTRASSPPPPTTPPPSHPSVASPFPPTPWSFNTGNFVNTSEYRKQVDDALREELLPSLQLDVPDLVNAVFGQVSQLEELTKTIFDLCQDGRTPLYKEGSGWTNWPSPAEEGRVLGWLQKLMDQLTIWVRQHSTRATDCHQLYRGPGTYVLGNPTNRKMDVGFTAGNGQGGAHNTNTGDSTATRKRNWSEILVVGELKSDPDQDRQQQAWIDLATYAREVFRAQDRRFVLGFTLCGSRMRLWHFDRSGTCGSCSFDIQQGGLAFVKVMLGYCLMTDEQLGLDPTIQVSEGKRYMEITRDGRAEKLVLAKIIKRQAVIVGRATTCWKAYRDTDKSKELLLVKDSWQCEERPEEGLLIQEATNRGVQNVARHYYHETVHVGGKIDDTRGNVRGGSMKEGARTSFRQKSYKKSGASALESQATAVAGQMQPSPVSRKRSSGSAQLEALSSTKRPRSSFGSRDPERPIANRVHRRIVTQDVGKRIFEGSSPTAVITGFIGAIDGEYIRIRIHYVRLTWSGHKSLLLDADILHRDISIGNILLTEDEKDGLLIDLDLAIRTSDQRASGAPSKTGTKVFMAIGALRGEKHTFMHDLESFFWVLFWICIHVEGPDKNGEVKVRTVPFYDTWNYDFTKVLADRKAGLVVDEKRFTEAASGFTPQYASLIPCVQELRKCVFPDGKNWQEKNKELYSQMRGVLEKAKGVLVS